MSFDLCSFDQIGNKMYLQHITVSGELGSGKSSVTGKLAQIFGMEIVSTGALQRELANSLNVTTLDVNRLAETDPSIDRRLDNLLQQRGAEEVPLIFDSRMAWHFVPNAFKIHLIVDPSVAADRLHKTRESSVEKYTSADHAEKAAAARAASERARFSSKYGVDIARLRNYDLVIDTSDAGLESVVSNILLALNGESPDGCHIWVSPKRVFPTIEPIRELAAVESGSLPASEYPTVGYSAPFIFALRGHDALSRALHAKAELLPAFLESENGEEVAAGLTTDDFLFSEGQRKWMYDWEDIHGFRFPNYPPTADQLGR